MTSKTLPFIQYWFVWNGWGMVRGRNAMCCTHCSHHGSKRCTDGICDYCRKHDIQLRGDLVYTDFDWIKGDKNIYD